MTERKQLYVWGVDVSTKRIAISFISPDESRQGVVARDFPKDVETGARLSAIYQVTCDLVGELAELRPALIVFVEQPAAYGRMPEPQLMYAVGCVQAAIYWELVDRNPHPTAVRTIPVANWKKTAIGHGNAKKHHVLTWAKQHEFESDHVCARDARQKDGLVKWCGHPDHDSADAWAIATAGARIIQRPDQLELVA